MVLASIKMEIPAIEEMLLPYPFLYHVVYACVLFPCRRAYPNVWDVSYRGKHSIHISRSLVNISHELLIATEAYHHERR